MFDGLRSRISLLAHSIIPYVANLVGMNIFNIADEIVCNSLQCPPVTLVYDFIPPTPITLDTSLRYDNAWDFPDDYILFETYDEGTPVALAADDKGGTKIYEYDAADNIILVNSGWGATVTAEGTIIWHGPRCDCRGEICILAPYGWDVEGLPLLEPLAVIQSQVFDSGNWIRNESYSGQMFELIYNTDDNPKIITTEVSFDTDNLSPFVNTKFHNEHFRKYTVKQFQDQWTQLTEATDNIRLYAPQAVFQGSHSRSAQIDKVLMLLDAFKLKWAGESESFDAFRNPDTLPDWSATW